MNLIYSWCVIRIIISVAVTQGDEMDLSGVLKFRFRRISVIVIIACFIISILAGCSGAEKPSGGEAQEEYSGEEQTGVMEEARIKLEAFINEVDAVISGNSTLSARLKGVNDVISEYSDTFPRVTQNDIGNWNDQEKKNPSTLVDKLSVTSGSSHSMSNEAYYYLLSVNLIYSLADFEQYVAGHTLDEGARFDPSRPIDGEQQYGLWTFGTGFGPGQVAVLTRINPNGAVIYNLGPDDDWVAGVPLADIESHFVHRARELLDLEEEQEKWGK